LDVIIVTSANTDDEGRELLRLLGMPFRRSSAADAAAATTAAKA
jgi:large subunit ribosomal protein L5